MKCVKASTPKVMLTVIHYLYGPYISVYIVAMSDGMESISCKTIMF